MGAALAGTQARERLNVKGFRALRSAAKGRRPLETCKLLKKLDQNFYFDIAGYEYKKSRLVHSAGSFRIFNKFQYIARLTVQRRADRIQC